MRRLLFAAVLAIAGCGPAATGEKEPEPPPIAFDGALVTDASARIAHGDRLASVLGCRGCHGKTLEGSVFVDSPEEGLLHASNLTRALPQYSDAQLVRLLREGVHPSGRDVWGMPSELFQHLSKPDESALIAYLRTLEPKGEPSPEPRLGPLAKELVAKGELKPSADFVRETKNVAPVELGRQHALGRYVSMVTCAECHGPKLEGREGGNPDLIVVGGYTRDEFEKLITEGTAPGGRKLKELMVNVAKGRFSKLTPNERDALYAYLKASAEQPQ